MCDDISVDSELTCPSTFKGTMEEQASWTLQALALGVAGGADVILGFQLYDDAVAPHEWYGFIRNDGTPRPAYTTFQVASRYLRDPDYARRVIDGPVDRVVLEGTPSGKVTVVWNRTGNDIVASIPRRRSSGDSCRQVWGRDGYLEPRWRLSSEAARGYLS